MTTVGHILESLSKYQAKKNHPLFNEDWWKLPGREAIVDHNSNMNVFKIFTEHELVYFLVNEGLGSGPSTNTVSEEIQQIKILDGALEEPLVFINCANIEEVVCGVFKLKDFKALKAPVKPRELKAPSKIAMETTVLFTGMFNEEIVKLGAGHFGLQADVAHPMFGPLLELLAEKLAKSSVAADGALGAPVNDVVAELFDHIERL